MPLNCLLPNGQNGKFYVARKNVMSYVKMLCHMEQCYVICKKWLVSLCLAVDKWIHKLCNIHSAEHYAFPY